MEEDIIKLLIVDDDATTRNGILKHLKWDKLGVGIVETAEHGEAAIELCKSFSPDIVISDIRMRKMTGVELCREIRILYPDCQLIFISGYSDKEYLKAAIQLDAVDYVEKPLNPMELSDAVLRSVDRYKGLKDFKKFENGKDLVKVDKRGQILSLFQVNKTQQDEENVRNLHLDYNCFRGFNLRLSTPRNSSLDSSKYVDEFFKDVSDIFKNLNLYYYYDKKSDVCFVISAEQNELNYNSKIIGWLSDMSKNIRIDSRSIFLTCGNIVLSRENVALSCSEAKIAMNRLFFEDFGGYNFYDEKDSIIPFVNPKLQNSLIKYINKSDIKKVVEVLEEIKGFFLENKQYDVARIKAYYIDLAYRIFDEARKLGFSSESNEIEDWGEIDKLDTINLVHENMLFRVKFYLDLVESLEEGNFAVNRAVQIIREGYGDPKISLKEIAAKVYLTPTYLSGLFKKKLGKTIGQFITEVRLENAQRLLQDKSLKLYHISEMVGYEDSNYFTKIFKKNLGITPSEFRERC